MKTDLTGFDRRIARLCVAGNPAARSKCLGFTLVELLVSLAIIGILIALLLPAVQLVRESARITKCQNNLKQMSLAMLTHDHVFRVFPSGGWGHEWVGVPERGSGPRQPGGWIYNILPYLEEGNLHDLGAGLSGDTANEAYSSRLQTPICLFVCPSRRECVCWPISDKYPYVRTPKPYGTVAVAPRADYAVNAGTSHVFSIAGPTSLEQGDDPKYWLSPAPRKFSGISHLHLGVSLKDVWDGAGKTYMVGEKHVPSNEYATGESFGDNESLYSGYCTDLHRFAGIIERQRYSLSPFVPPLPDDAPSESSIPADIRFGSAHQSGFNMAFCGGAVRFVAYEVDPEIHLRAGHRRDRDRPLKDLDYRRSKEKQ